MTERQRLVHLTTVDMSLELLLGPQLRVFRDAGFEVIGMSAPGPYVAGLEADGIRHIGLQHATRSISLFADVKAFWELYRWFRKLRPDIVHTHNPKTGVMGRVAARLARVPKVINTQHGLYAQDTDGWRRKLACYSLERFAAMFSDVELVQNEEDLATMRRLRVPERKLVLFGNGIDLDRFNPDRYTDLDRRWARAELGATSDDDVIIGCVARLTAEKGIPELLDAAEMVMADNPNARFAIIGPAEPDDAEATQMTTRAKEVGVCLLGRRLDVDRLYTGMDIFVLPSHREGFPRAVMEAAAMGLPVVGTDIRGMRQAVRQGDTGVLVPVRSAPSLALAVATLADDAPQRTSMTNAARPYAGAAFGFGRQLECSLAHYSERPPSRPGPTPSRPTRFVEPAA